MRAFYQFRSFCTPLAVFDNRDFFFLPDSDTVYLKTS